MAIKNSPQVSERVNSFNRFTVYHTGLNKIFNSPKVYIYFFCLANMFQLQNNAILYDAFVIHLYYYNCINSYSKYISCLIWRSKRNIEIDEIEKTREWEYFLMSM